jgi:hypothetical protein
MPNSLQAEAQELSRLHDIHLPAAISWWPLAPGYYILAILLLCALVAVAYYGARKKRHASARRMALSLLKQYQLDYQKNHDAGKTAACLSELLKRVALAYFPRTEVAALQGQAWITFLNETSKKLDFNSVQEALLDAPYQAHFTGDLQALFELARAWISQRRGSCLN